MTKKGQLQTYSNGVKILKWSHPRPPTEELMRKEMEGFGYEVYDLQTCPPWFERSRHAHDEEVDTQEFPDQTPLHLQ